MNHLNNEKVFVSRGGIKLQAALDVFKVNVKDLVVLDVGSSTGGFVDCLLQNGAALVYSVDTAYGELAWKLRNDPRVVVMERTNILHLTSLSPDVIPSDPPTGGERRNLNSKQIKIATLRQAHLDSIGAQGKLSRNDKEVKVDLITIDASWTKLELILPVVQKFLKPGGIIIALLKPHYQANKRDLVKGVLPKEIAERVKDEVTKRIQDLGFKIQEVIESPILGGGGNTEYLLKIYFA